MSTTSPVCSGFAVLSSSKVKFSFWIRVCLSIRNNLVLLLSNLTEYIVCYSYFVDLCYCTLDFK